MHVIGKQKTDQKIDRIKYKNLQIIAHGTKLTKEHYSIYPC